MVKEAEAHAEDDKKAREAIEAKNNAETLCYSTEKALKEYGDKISSSEKADIEAAIKDLRDTIASSNASAEEIKGKTEKLQQVSMQLGQKVYEAAQQAQQAQQAQGNAGADPQPGAGSQGPSSSDNGDTMDADFEEVK